MATMARPNQPPKVMLICGMISSDVAFLSRRGKKWSPLWACRSGQRNDPLDLTHYYDQEMGSPLYRLFVS
jgi:hypothetical protein